MSWQSFDTAPKDGRWIIAFCEHAEPQYVVIRWWDGVLPDDDDDLSCSEEGDWVGPDEFTVEREEWQPSAWTAFDPHPNGLPASTSYHQGGPKLPTRHERGITDEEVANVQAWSDAYQRHFDETGEYPDIETFDPLGNGGRANL